MNMLIVSKSFIVRESIANIFNKIEKKSTTNAINEIGDICSDELNMYDTLFVHIQGKNNELLNDIIQIKNQNNKVLILDQFKNEKILKFCIDNNIDAYITDIEDEHEFKYIIDKLNSNKKFYDSQVIEKIFYKKNTNNLDTNLTQREKEVIEEVGKGLSNRDIANKLSITEFTVKKHISSIFNKLNLKNRKDIIIHVNSKI